MIMKKIFLYTMFSILCTPVFAEDLIKYYIKDNDLYILNREDNHSYIVRDISSRSNLIVHVALRSAKKETPEAPKEDDANKSPNPEEKTPKTPAELTAKDRAQVTKLLLESRSAYAKGHVNQAWDSVEAAEEINANDYRVKKMKGSLLIEMGDTESGIHYWEESLKLKPDQADLKAKLRSLKKESAK